MLMLTKVKSLEIYELPDGKCYFALPSSGGAYYLYPVESDLPPAYEIRIDGVINSWSDKDSCYTLDQLNDTGRQFDVESEKHYVLVLSNGEQRTLFTSR